MAHDGLGGDDRPWENVPSDDDQAAVDERGPGGSDFGTGDFATLLGNPGAGEEVERVRLRCPDPGCDQTGTAADYRAAYWPRCERHLRRMVLVAAG